MVIHVQTASTVEITYPDTDGQPMAGNTKPFHWIVTIQENLELIFADDPNVFVVADLLWYPIEGRNTIRQAPNTMVVFGRPKGDRELALENEQMAAKLRKLGVDPTQL